MKRAAAVFIVGVLLSGAVAPGQERPEPQGRAAETIRELGGKVIRDPQVPDGPVSVVLTGSQNPEACVPHLKEFKNLQSCDL